MTAKKFIILLSILFISNLSIAQTKDSTQTKPQIEKQKIDTVYINNPSLENAERMFDRTLTLLGIVIGGIGVLVTIIAIIVGFGGFFGYKDIQQRKKINKEVEDFKERIGDYEKQSKQIFEGLKKFKEETDKMRKEIPEISLNEKPSEELKKQLDEFGNRVEFLEALGSNLTIDDYLKRGNDFYFKKEYQLALKAFNKAIEKKQNSVGLWHNKGMVLLELERWEEALEAFNKAIEIKPGVSHSLTNKALALQKLGRLNEALKIHNKAIEINSKDYRAWYNIAMFYSIKKEKELVIENLKKAIELYSNYKELAKTNEDFKWLWDDEDFKKLVE